jgi:hypothetical protein
MATVSMTCLYCKQVFDAPKAKTKDGRRKFCSVPCKNKHLSTLTGEKNPRFGKGTTPTAKQNIARAAHMRTLAREQRGEKHPGWKGGTFISEGYRHVLIRDLPESDQALVQPMATKSDYILEHRLVMARTLGRPLTRKETVHHVNGVRLDNRPENLELLGNSEHSKMHREMVREIGRLRQQNATLLSVLATCLLRGSDTSTIPA